MTDPDKSNHPTHREPGASAPPAATTTSSPPAGDASAPAGGGLPDYYADEIETLFSCEGVLYVDRSLLLRTLRAYGAAVARECSYAVHEVARKLPPGERAVLTIDAQEPLLEIIATLERGDEVER